MKGAHSRALFHFMSQQKSLGEFLGQKVFAIFKGLILVATIT
jgi:hypothetical protein